MLRLRDDQSERIREHFPEEHLSESRPGRKPVPARATLEAVLWILNTGAQWHMLPQCYPNYKTVHRRFQQWCDREVLRDILTQLVNTAQPRDSYRRELLGQKDFIAMIAVSREEVVKGLTSYVLRKFEQERSEIYSYDLAVAKAYRRKGVATALIRYLASIAKSCKAWVIFVQADPGDEAAMRLYGSLGHMENVYHFDIPVEGLGR
jgi:transposase